MAKRSETDGPDQAVTEERFITEPVGPPSSQETYEQPAKDQRGRDLGPFESPNTPDPSESVFIDTRQVEGSETVLMRGDQPDRG